MSRKLSAVVLALMMAAVMILPAAAQSGTGQPVADVSVNSQQATTNFDGQDLLLEGTAGPGGVCSPNRTVFIKWDLSTHSSAISGAVIVLTTTSVTSNATGRDIKLFQVDDDNWTEAMTYNTGRPALGAELQTFTLPSSLPAGTKIQLNSPNITTFVNSQIAGDKVASFALQFSTCAASSLQSFEDSESGAAVGPSLQAPLSVGMADMEAKSSVSWPLYAGLGAVALFVVAGVLITRRRTA